MTLSPSPDTWVLSQEEGRGKVVRHMSDAAVETMAEKARKADIRMSVHLARGLPSPQILHAAKRKMACLIAVGSSGNTGLARLLLGSTGEQVKRSPDGHSGP